MTYSEERLPLALGELYASYGYRKYRMRRFEEYALYVDNMDFLADKNVITFGGADGKLLALRPDVTLSIINNTKADCDCGEKLYYNEAVFRLSGDDGYAEIRQTGVEVIGKVDILAMAEIVELIIKSLAMLSDSYALDVSHSGLIHGIVSSLPVDSKCKAKIYDEIARKGVHNLRAIVRSEGLPEETAASLSALCALSGAPKDVLPALKDIAVGDEAVGALNQLTRLCELLDKRGLGDKIRLDFSVVNHLDYYNGIIYNGFIREYPKAVIVGGQYDKLPEKLGKRAQAIGFAVNLEATPYAAAPPVDIALVYGEDDDVSKVMERADELRAQGKSVYVGMSAPKCRIGTVLAFGKEEDLC
ncbi:MAG: ATP phosphoribosyltransferase regulatory subunit [Clostridia bacterium]|nr:ATP phosphoribosyltransferase regulatory subunit [Clostridia bacterium]